MPGKFARAADLGTAQVRPSQGGERTVRIRPCKAIVGAIRRGLLAPLPHPRKSTIAAF
jgi:hypothetical protein